MINIINLELKKIFTKKSTLIFWAFTLFVSYSTIGDFSLEETYADIFNKFYGLSPLMGILMFMMFAGSFVLEYSSNMDEIIKTTKNGRKQIVLAKSIAYGISASIINLSIFFTICFKAFSSFNFKNIDMPIKNLWYFGNSGSNITVLQMILIMSATIILGSFLFTQLGLFLSSISKKATMPFFLGGILMGLPYFSDMPLMGDIPKELVGYTPLWGMYSCQVIRYGISNIAFVVFGAVVIIGSIVLYKLTCRGFSKEA